MFDILYKRRLKQDLEDWVDQGWVSSSGAGKILTSVENDDGRTRLPMVLAGIGIVCVALALAAFIAANWDGIPRMAKLSGIAAIVIAANLAAAFAARSGRKSIADLATAFATLVFVGGMALVGQIFHLPADWAGGAFLVSLGALAAAWITGSRASLVVAAIAAVLWQVGRTDLGPEVTSESLLGLAILVAILLHPVAFPMRIGRWAATLLLLTAYGRWLSDTVDLETAHDALLVAVPMLGFAGLAGILIQLAQVGDLFVKWSSDYPDRSHGRWLMLHSLQDVGFAILSGLVVLALVAEQEFSDTGLINTVGIAPVSVTVGLAILLCAAGFVLSFKTAKPRPVFAAVLLGLLAVASPLLNLGVIVVSVLCLAALILISLVGTWYGNAFWTLCGYAGLTAAFLWLLHVTIGSLLDQSLFFLIAGLVLLALAFGAAKLLRRGSAGGGA
ncbi:DUF2157 domain-containing protein [Roseibium sp. RKSG952]|uniref:DUF2157 domain-containing protein n=1 Tax=Roseibium sp. RKSG952 TaxID=2529384 RepID=UPI0012BB7285|nr:DUF2157 domain-containing protein [Roseibium sp. RKSG952]MTH99888.1 DUF2157 domain-containing protein [Roseibium sp. RKSG952]